MSTQMYYCEQCQGSYSIYHYSDTEDCIEEFHMVGEQFGPHGALLYKGELYDKLIEKLGFAIPEAYEGEGSMQSCIIEWAEDVSSGNMQRVRKATGKDPEMPVFLLVASDRLVMPALEEYRLCCIGRGIYEQAEEVEKAQEEFHTWRLANKDKVKLPDHKHVPLA